MSHTSFESMKHGFTIQPFLEVLEDRLSPGTLTISAANRIDIDINVISTAAGRDRHGLSMAETHTVVVTWTPGS